MAKDLYGGGRGFLWLAALAVVLFLFYSLAVAASTADKCDGSPGGRHWEVMPPRWECDRVRGFG